MTQPKIKLYDILFEYKSVDSDMNVSDDAKKFADIMDKAALRLGYKQPVITSGLLTISSRSETEF